MVWIDSERCRGCGLCVRSCPRNAIELKDGIAEINQARCNRCLACVSICPSNAVFEQQPADFKELENEIAVLQKQADELLKRIDSL